MDIKLKYIPWVEKYRPVNFNDIILNKNNENILKNILSKNQFPNLLLYGPPGTGKTTTIINLINDYQEKYHSKNNGEIIHLNASDDRGIDIIRNQINQFVNSRGLFANGIKFVILDEVDYMTKTAQQAFKYLLQTADNNVRFCLICNYISKIEDSLQNEFVKLHFNQLPKDKIKLFIKNIINIENINISDDILDAVIDIYNCDIRSMINYIQSNQLIIEKGFIVSSKLYEELYNSLINKEDIESIRNKIDVISKTRNIDKKSLIKNLINYIIKNKREGYYENFLNLIENLLHSQIYSEDDYVNYFVIKFLNLNREM